MTTFDRFDPFERRITEAIDEIAAARRPDYLDDVLRQTAATSQRRRWTIPERWVPVDARPAHYVLVLVTLAALVIAGLALIGTSQPEPRPLVLGLFERTGPLPWKAALEPTLRLRDGSVLVSGGPSLGGSLQRFDPATGMFVELPTAFIERAIKNREVDQIEGWIEEQDGHIVTLRTEWDHADPAVPSWIVADRLPAPGAPGRPVEIARSDPFRLQATVALPDGRIVIFGQEPAAEAVVALLFDPGTSRFMRIGSTPLIAYVHQVALLPDGRILIVDQSLETLTVHVVVFDAAARTFRGVGDLPYAQSASLTALPDGRALFAGGGTPGDGTWTATNAAYLIDPRASTIVALQPLPEARWMHAAALTADGRVLLAGGGINSAPGTPSRTTLLFDPATLAFEAGPDLLDGRMNATAVPLATGQVLIFGHSTFTVTEVPTPASTSSEVFR